MPAYVPVDLTTIVPETEAVQSPEFKLTKENYKLVKHLNKAQMEEYIQMVYTLGVSDSVEVFITGLEKLLDEVPKLSAPTKKKIMTTIAEKLR